MTNEKTKHPHNQEDAAEAGIASSALLSGDRELAITIANQILQWGHRKDLNLQCDRITFKAGTYGKDEIENGGLCRTALIEEITAGIQKHFSR